ncbi:hypothetical protein, partial [Aquitalea pelogenes]|uniref:hypothetical protein n=1 Tax=Aquitalea pelogenes TaxID=1293573 RepID=UPI0035B0499C
MSKSQDGHILYHALSRVRLVVLFKINDLNFQFANITDFFAQSVDEGRSGRYSSPPQQTTQRRKRNA